MGHWGWGGEDVYMNKIKIIIGSMQQVEEGFQLPLDLDANKREDFLFILLFLSGRKWENNFIILFEFRTF